PALVKPTFAIVPLRHYYASDPVHLYPGIQVDEIEHHTSIGTDTTYFSPLNQVTNRLLRPAEVFRGFPNTNDPPLNGLSILDCRFCLDGVGLHSGGGSHCGAHFDPMLPGNTPSLLFP